ncbi:MAG TPA: hypothetical protein VEZ90_15355, partial [Blastocatellia bacterium]|nr:hypothetical protein [Blastocatellia bacterium]
MSPDSSYTPDSARLERGFWIAGGCSFIRGRKIVFGVLVVASALIGVWALALRRSPSLPPVGQLAPVTVNAAKGQTVTTLDGRAVLTVRDIEYRK